MHEIQLSRFSHEQNVEIIYNNNKRIYYKTMRRIKKHEILKAFPSKDLEIALGLQYIPSNMNSLNGLDDEEYFNNINNRKYMCKKCSQSFNYPNNLMLHTRYFCTFRLNNFFMNKTMNQNLSNLESSQPYLKRKNEAEVVATEISPISSNKKRRFFQTNKSEWSSNQISPPQSSTFSSSSSVSESNEDISSFNHMLKSSQLNYYNNLAINPLSSAYSAFILNYYKQVQIKDYLSNYLLTFLQNNQNIKQIISQPVISTSAPSIPRAPLIVPSAPNTPPTVSGPPSVASTSSSNLADMLTNPQRLQNWCAKCNTSFRLTTDLVYHMRTFHKKDEPESVKINNVRKEETNKNEILKLAGLLNDKSGQLNLNKEIKNKVKSLKCDICHEVFKEKHHLSRHMTSHR
jgi:hypothetical protein